MNAHREGAELADPVSRGGAGSAEAMMELVGKTAAVIDEAAEGSWGLYFLI